MSEPTLELQKAVIAKLLQSGPLMALVNDRVFDDVPPGAGFPRITYGDEDIVADDFDCIVSNIVFLPIHIWSTKIGKPECKEIAGMVRNILHEEELSLDGFNLLSLHHDTTRYLRDPDGKTNHGVVTFRAMIDELPLVTEGVADEVIPDWVPDGVYLFADPENARYWLDGVGEVTADDLFEIHLITPYKVDVAGGWQMFEGKVKTGIVGPIVSQGATFIYDLTTSNTAGNANGMQAQLTDYPIGTGTLMAQVRTVGSIHNTNLYSGSYTQGSSKNVLNQRNKCGAILVPGTRVAISCNGVLDGSIVQGAPPGAAPTHCIFSEKSLVVALHSVAVYLGNKSDSEFNVLTTL